MCQPRPPVLATHTRKSAVQPVVAASKELATTSLSPEASGLRSQPREAWGPSTTPEDARIEDRAARSRRSSIMPAEALASLGRPKDCRSDGCGLLSSELFQGVHGGSTRPGCSQRAIPAASYSSTSAGTEARAVATAVPSAELDGIVGCPRRQSQSSSSQDQHHGNSQRHLSARGGERMQLPMVGPLNPQPLPLTSTPTASDILLRHIGHAHHADRAP